MRITNTGIIAAIAILLLIIGFFAPLDDYLTPKSGLGLGLGIFGVSAMLIAVLGYSIPKRVRFLRNLNIVNQVFAIHKILGIFGPIAILYHCRFHLGVQNSNIALYSMLAVVSAGLIGRYLFMRPILAKYLFWWRIGHLPLVGLLSAATIAHIYAYLAY